MVVDFTCNATGSGSGYGSNRPTGNCPYGCATRRSYANAFRGLVRSVAADSSCLRSRCECASKNTER